MPPSQRWLTKCGPEWREATEIGACAGRLVPTNSTLPPCDTVCDTKSCARAKSGTVWDRSRIWMPFRSPKMYGFMRGFQRCVWWPKCAPASINCCMVTTGAAIVFLLPVEPLGISDRVLPGTGMCDSHVECRALTYRSERTQDLTEPGIERSEEHTSELQ